MIPNTTPEVNPTFYRGVRRPVQVPDSFDYAGCYSTRQEVWPQVAVETLGQEAHWLGNGGVYEWGLECDAAWHLAQDLLLDALPDLSPDDRRLAVSRFYHSYVVKMGVTWRLSREWIASWWQDQLALIAEAEHQLGMAALGVKRG